MTVYIVGPSHIHDTCLGVNKQKLVCKGIVPIASLGPPNFSTTTLRNLQHAQSLLQPEDQLVWMVADWRIGNYDVHKLQASEGLWHDTPAKPNNISYAHICQANDTALIQHQFKLIDHVISTCPNIKLIFWCLYYRTKVCKSSSLPLDGQYDNVLSRYKENAIDIDNYVIGDPSSWYKDAGGHPSMTGYDSIITMVIHACGKDGENL